MNVHERPEYYSRHVRIMHCAPVNLDHAGGEPATGITIGHNRSGDVSQWVISLADTRLLVAKMLVSLATSEDKLAQKLLDDYFSADEDGEFVWPDWQDGSS
jgi:hypothetical protein